MNIDEIFTDDIEEIKKVFFEQTKLVETESREKLITDAVKNSFQENIASSKIETDVIGTLFSKRRVYVRL